MKYGEGGGVDEIRWIEKEEMLRVPALEQSDQAVLEKSPRASVLMLAYNHKNYLRQSVESVIEQDCNFPFEILIGEDASSDGTRDVAISLQHKFPEKIRLVLSDKNVGILNNFLRLLVRARGEFVAILEGDDYWIDRRKLQLQVSLLDDYPGYAWCGSKTENRLFWGQEKESYSLEEILKTYLFHTSTVVFRRDAIERYPDHAEITCLDSILVACLSEKGDCGFLNRKTSYYRRHQGSVWNGAALVDQLAMTARCIDYLNSYFDDKYRKELAQREAWIYAMEIGNIHSLGFWEGWTKNFSVVKWSSARLAITDFLLWKKLVIRVAFQPVFYSGEVARKKLALRKRMNAIFYR